MPTWAAQRLGTQNPDLVPSIGTTTTTTKTNRSFGQLYGGQNDTSGDLKGHKHTAGLPLE